MDTIDRIVRLKEAIELTGLSRSTIARLEVEGKFPKRFKISERSVGWNYSNIRDWILRRKHGFK